MTAVDIGAGFRHVHKRTRMLGISCVRSSHVDSRAQLDQQKVRVFGLSSRDTTEDPHDLHGVGTDDERSGRVGPFSELRDEREEYEGCVYMTT